MGRIVYRQHHQYPASLSSFRLDATRSDISMRNISFFLGALLLVDGVFGVHVTVPVMEGDSVTLKHHTVIPKDDSADWWFGDKRIAKKKIDGLFSISEGDDVGFKDRLNVDKHNGSLTITNIRTKDTGDYKLQILGKTETTEIFSVTVTGKTMTVSVKEGESITLDTGLVEIKGYDLIMWKFKNQLIAEINNMANTFLKYDTSDERFNGRLQLHPQTGSLIISNSRITDSEDYHLNMNSSSHTVQRTISVTVSVSDTQTPDPGLSPGAVAGIVVAVLLVVLAAVVIYHRRKISELQGRRNVAEKNGTNVPLNDETALETGQPC